MRFLLVVLAVAAAGASVSLADTYVAGPCIGLEPGAPGDLSLPEAWNMAGPADTVLLLPGTYTIDSENGWPLLLHDWCPWLVSRDGPEQTVIVGPGDTCAFAFWPGEEHGILRIRDVGFQDVQTIVRFEPYYEVFDLEFVGCDFNACGTVRLDWLQDAGNHITGCAFHDVDGTALRTYHYNGTVEDCEFYNNTWGLYGVCCESPTIRGNYFHHNSACGLVVTWNYTVEDNVLEHNAVGLQDEDSTIRGNIIRYNGIGIEHWGSVGHYHENDIYGNTEYNYYAHGAAGYVVDMTMNWWGTTDPVEIAAGIYDCEDNPGTACVNFEPFCAAPGCQPVTVEAKSWGMIKAMYR